MNQNMIVTISLPEGADLSSLRDAIAGWAKTQGLIDLRDSGRPDSIFLAEPSRRRGIREQLGDFLGLTS